MTYVAVLRNAEAAEADVARYEPEIVARVARACPAAKCVARGNSSSKCLDLFETPDEATASVVRGMVCCPGLTDALVCGAIPWELFANDEV
jgi:hypothetical protein